MVVSLIITALSTLSDMIFTGGSHLYIMALSEMFHQHKGSAIGIIGGADGPTAIFLSGNPFISIIWSKLAFFAILMLLYVPTKKFLNHRYLIKIQKNDLIKNSQD